MVIASRPAVVVAFFLTAALGVGALSTMRTLISSGGVQLGSLEVSATFIDDAGDDECRTDPEAPQPVTAMRDERINDERMTRRMTVSPWAWAATIKL